MWLWRPFFVAFCCTLLRISVCQSNISELTGENILSVFRSILDMECPEGECDARSLISEETRDHSAVEQPISENGHEIQSEARRHRREDLEFFPEEKQDHSEVVQSERSVNVDIASSLVFCEQLMSTIDEIELRHPEFKSEKFELLSRFRYYLAEYSQFFKVEYPGAPVLKFLNLILAVIEKIKYDYHMGLAEEAFLTKDVDAEKQVDVATYVSTQAPEEIIAEEETDILSPGFVGSVRGIPGEHYPNYSEVPITSFTCEDKKYIPGFYADLETGCQVFHVCYQHRRESFLCPVGTTFNQPILACDYWYSSNCSLSPLYYDINAPTEEIAKPTSEVEATIGALITSVIEGEKTVPPIEVKTDAKVEQNELASIIKFLPVKAEVLSFPEEPKEVLVESPVPVKDVEETASKVFDSLLSTSTQIVGKTRDVVKAIPDVGDAEIVKHGTIGKAAVSAVPILGKAKLAKVKIATAAVPFVAKTKLAAGVPLVSKTKLAAAAVPLLAKAKLAAAAGVPLVSKTKLAAAGAAKAKIAAVPFIAKTKLAGAAKAKVAAAVPLVAKTKLAAASATKVAATAKAIKVAAAGLPKFKVAKASIPVVKGKMLALPLGKKKFAAAALPFKVKAATKFVPAVKLGAAAKSKLAFIPLKAKIAKAAVISPVTKKALALAYMKLMKAKKMAIMG
ncbi:uncharacterized protein LOC118181259 [Stegodyphus dumicola]|uniref:uncharacterized protein LOC118181259 n=1 Tax=Stegodyphus dumicola TaxID=202533 RepID=UPI0015A94E14|nr:uncharacterized protein LOC118181259 [Stegodyphus dumicola]